MTSVVRPGPATSAHVRRLRPLTEGGVHVRHDLVMLRVVVVGIVTSTSNSILLLLLRRSVLLLWRMLVMLMLIEVI